MKLHHIHPIKYLVYLIGVCTLIRQNTITPEFSYLSEVGPEELGMIYTSLGIVCSFSNWEGADVGPKSGLGKFLWECLWNQECSIVGGSWLTDACGCRDAKSGSQERGFTEHWHADTSETVQINGRLSGTWNVLAFFELHKKISDKLSYFVKVWKIF